MLLIANLINPAQHWVDQMNTFPVVGLGREKKQTKNVLGEKKIKAVQGNVKVNSEIKDREKAQI